MTGLKWSVLAMLSFAAVQNELAYGRPRTMKVFNTTYEPYYRSVPDAHRCTVCHSSDKRVLNNYGHAVESTLGTKNESDLSAIERELRKTEELPSAIEGKTFGELIREGRLPASR